MIQLLTVLLLFFCTTIVSVSAASSLDDLDSILGTLASKSTIHDDDDDDDNNNNNNNNDREEGLPEEAKLWRHLGKVQLDAHEYAEARLVFCEGAKRCPWDPKLVHHKRVYETFHGTQDDDDDDNQKVEGGLSPPSPLTMPMENDHDLFLSLDVPEDSEIPISIRNWKGKIPALDRRRLIHASTKPILSKDACQFLIDSAVDAVQRHGWTKDRHVQAPTCDIPVFDLSPSTKRWCRNAFHQVLFPLLASIVSPELDINPQDFRIQDCFIVRYDGDNEAPKHGPGFNQLKPHVDESLLSLTIALNDMNEYEGGGLFIQSSGDLLNGDAGTVLCFAGGLVHGGYPVSRGTRWILTVFLYVDANESRKKPGYTLDVLKEKMKLATKDQ